MNSHGPISDLSIHGIRRIKIIFVCQSLTSTCNNIYVFSKTICVASIEPKKLFCIILDLGKKKCAGLKFIMQTSKLSIWWQI